MQLLLPFQGHSPALFGVDEQGHDSEGEIAQGVYCPQGVAHGCADVARVGIIQFCRGHALPHKRPVLGGQYDKLAGQEQHSVVKVPQLRWQYRTCTHGNPTRCPALAAHGGSGCTERGRVLRLKVQPALASPGHHEAEAVRNLFDGGHLRTLCDGLLTQRRSASGAFGRTS